MINEEDKKLLARIRGDAPRSGDGEKLVSLLERLEINSLRTSVDPADVGSRWKQGKALAYQELQKYIAEAWEGR